MQGTLKADGTWLQLNVAGNPEENPEEFLYIILMSIFSERLFPWSRTVLAQEDWMPYLISTSNPPLTISQLVTTNRPKITYDPVQSSVSPPSLVLDNQYAFMAICSNLQFTFLPEMDFTSSFQQKNCLMENKEFA